MPEVTNALALTFDGAPLTFVKFDGSPVVVARELGTALGYSDPGRLGKMIGAEWSDDFRAGVDYHILTGPDLARFKVDSVRHTDRVDPRAPSILVLTESGLWMVAIRTEKDLGVRFRRFLVDEVIPKLARGETVGGKPTDTARLREMRHAIRLLPKGDPRRGPMVDEYTTALGHPPIALPVTEPARPTDGVAAFVETCCTRGKGEVVAAADLFTAYAKQGGLLSVKGFGLAMGRLGFRSRITSGYSRVYTGISLPDDPAERTVLAWARGRAFELVDLRRATGVARDNRTLGMWLRRAGFESVRARSDYRYFDRWREVISE